MSIKTEIDRINNAKTNIRAAIESKGVSVPSDTPIDRMAEYIEAIPIITVYEWERYAVILGEYTEQRESWSNSSFLGATNTYYWASKYTAANGTFTLTNPVSMQIQNVTANLPLYTFLSNQATSGSELFYVTECAKGVGGTYRPSGEKLTFGYTTQSRGDYIENVISYNENAFPDDGIHTDGYWYVRVGTNTGSS